MPQATRENLGYLLAKASQRWNELLQEGFAAAGFPEVKASYGSVLIPLFEQDGLRMGEIARRVHLSKQTMTTMVRLCERDGLVKRRPDPDDRRAARVHLTSKARRFQPAAEAVLAGLERDAEVILGPRRGSDLRRSLADLQRLGRSTRAA
ncbi:MAG TPA: MarR family transcriptional regulator [Thermoleophilaceae bacterium]|nr:MarR family transcriptional regulator [Thermoleophilaceae bacterium]